MQVSTAGEESVVEGGWCWPGEGAGGCRTFPGETKCPLPLSPLSCHLLRKHLNPCSASRSGALSPWAHSQVGETPGDMGCAGARWGHESPEKEPGDPCSPPLLPRPQKALGWSRVGLEQKYSWCVNSEPLAIFLQLQGGAVHPDLISSSVGWVNK